MSKHGETAYRLFFEGYNCSQCVTMAFAEEMGLTPEQVARFSAGFGGGFGRMREVCGAFSGVTLVLGALYGSADPTQRAALYARVQALAERFKARCGGSLVCRELLHLDKNDAVQHSPHATPRTPEFYQKRPCPQIIRTAAEILEEYLAENPL